MPTFDSESPDLQMVGCKMKVTVGESAVYEGTLFSFDKKTNSIILEEQLHHTTLKKGVRIINAKHIKELEVREPRHLSFPAPTHDCLHGRS